jgi:hypothetical protein
VQKTILLIGGGSMVDRLPEYLNRADLKIDVFGMSGSALSRSTFVNQFFGTRQTMLVGNPPELNADLLKFLETASYDMFVIGGDTLARKIGESSLSLDKKLQISPIQNSKFLDLIGSKVGLARVSKELNLSSPKSAVANSMEELLELAAQEPSEFLVKGDSEGGGTRVQKFSDASELARQTIPQIWFPVVVQKYVTGAIVSVEALFIHGRLSGWLYSTVLASMSDFGPSTRRKFANPPLLDFESDLIRLGRAAELHGFFNTSWILSDELNRHVLFEADSRPNSWHQFGPRLGVNWATQLTVDQELPIQSPNNLPAQGLSFWLYPRSLSDAFLTLKWRTIFAWMMRRPGTWKFRNRLDKAVNRAEDKLVWFFPSMLIAQQAVKVWARLPVSMQKYFERQGLKATIAKILGV